MSSKRLVRGKDWHAWVWKPGSAWPRARASFYFAEPRKPSRGHTETGKWVRVKFVEVKP